MKESSAMNAIALITTAAVWLDQTSARVRDDRNDERDERS